MITFGITGSISSGKTTASKIISKNKGPLFNADEIVKRLYKDKTFVNFIKKKLNLKSNNPKNEIKNKILSRKIKISKLGKIVHPFVRKKMFIFLKKNKKRKFVFLEIPLLIESKLMKYFNVIIFINSQKKIRLKRYKNKGGDKQLFNVLDNQQMKANKKSKYCDHNVVNNKSLAFLKNKLLHIISIYE